jgi:hypothetical protein
MESSDEEYEALFGVTSDRGSAMEILEEWLERKFWNFNRGFHQFDGHSEGHCILAGIEPEYSQTAPGEYGPVFLPNSSDTYGTSINSPEELWSLKDAIDHHIDDLRSLGLRGRIHCHEAIRKSVRMGLAPPWLEAANNDLNCARLLPAELRSNDRIRAQIKRETTSSGGKARAKKSAKTLLLQTRGREEFNKLKLQGFRDCKAKSTDRPMAVSIANQIYHILGAELPADSDELPNLTTFTENVSKWLKE